MDNLVTDSEAESYSQYLDEWGDLSAETSQDLLDTRAELERVLEQIATLETTYLKDWDATVEAGLEDAREIARDTLRKLRA